jgi:hypothetical protein
MGMQQIIAEESLAKEELLHRCFGAYVRCPDGEGIITWKSDTRIGVSIDGVVGKPSYFQAEDVIPMYPGLEPGQNPKRGWFQLLEDHKKLTRRGLPRKGHQVRKVSTGETGKVFWVAGPRLGFKSGSATIWALACEVVKVTKKGDSPYTPWVPDVEPVTWEYIVGSLPVPYNMIRGIQYNPEMPGLAASYAYDEEGMMLLPLNKQVAMMLKTAFDTGEPLTPEVF